jgi:hypothetical protein
MMKFPMWKFAVLGLLDSLQGILSFYSDSHVPGKEQQDFKQIKPNFSNQQRQEQRNNYFYN